MKCEKELLSINYTIQIKYFKIKTEWVLLK
uniref:Uncharacterized protein n=1 Tax=Pyramimonas orientalis virus TaxID=455367 RepID=A0A7M3UPD0_POV01|nr:hypothetical protein HWQ62_00482 [Pyramimonas orientalis virus]